MRFHNLPDEVYNDLLDKASKYEDLKDAISDIKAEIREQKSRYTDKEVLEIIDRYLDVIGEKEGDAE